MMKLHLCAVERRLLGFQRIERETNVGSITLTIDLERGIAVRMQETRMADTRLVQCQRGTAKLPTEVEAVGSRRCN